MYKQPEIFMSTNFTYSYTAELEHLILAELLPVYERWHKEQGIDINYSSIPIALLQNIKRKKSIPRLLQPLQIQS
jgi:hypothetical protein